MSTPAAHPPPPPADLDEALARVRTHGGRVTAATRAVAALLHADDVSRTAEEIGDRLPDLERSVVYRVLARFEELGIAEHVHLGHGRAVYRRAGLGTVPVVCTACGRVVELARDDVAVFVADVADRTGIAVDLTHFPLTGRCRTCAVEEPT